MGRSMAWWHKEWLWIRLVTCALGGTPSYCCQYKLMLWFDASGYCWNNHVFWMIFVLGQSMHEQNGTRGIIYIFYSTHLIPHLFTTLQKRRELGSKSVIIIGDARVSYWPIFCTSLITVPELFENVNSAQFLSHF